MPRRQDDRQSVDTGAAWADVAIVTPWSYGFGQDTTSDLKAYVYTDRPVYRPGHTVHIKAVIRQNKDDDVLLPSVKTRRSR